MKENHSDLFMLMYLLDSAMVRHNRMSNIMNLTWFGGTRITLLSIKRLLTGACRHTHKTLKQTQKWLKYSWQGGAFRLLYT